MEGQWDDAGQIVHAEWGRRWSGGTNQALLLVRTLKARGVQGAGRSRRVGMPCRFGDGRTGARARCADGFVPAVGRRRPEGVVAICPMAERDNFVRDDAVARPQPSRGVAHLAHCPMASPADGVALAGGGTDALPVGAPCFLRRRRLRSCRRKSPSGRCPERAHRCHPQRRGKRRVCPATKRPPMGAGAVGTACRCLRRRWGRTDGGGEGL